MSVPAPLEFPANFTDDSKFLNQALNEYLKAHYLPWLMFYELKAEAQMEVRDQPSRSLRR